jgi:hypothetical protein
LLYELPYKLNKLKQAYIIYSAFYIIQLDFVLLLTVPSGQQPYFELAQLGTLQLERSLLLIVTPFGQHPYSLNAQLPIQFERSTLLTVRPSGQQPYWDFEHNGAFVGNFVQLLPLELLNVILSGQQP